MRVSAHLSCGGTGGLFRERRGYRSLPSLYSNPIRLEFLGDTLESIRHFDPFGQRSLASLKEFVLLPANEIIMGEENIGRARSMGRLPTLLKEACSFPGQEAWLNHFYPRLSTLFDYLPQQASFCSWIPFRSGSRSRPL
jgi:transcription-repair coupling factor (superfamily II helicase)